MEIQAKTPAGSGDRKNSMRNLRATFETKPDKKKKKKTGNFCHRPLVVFRQVARTVKSCESRHVSFHFPSASHNLSNACTVGWSAHQSDGETYYFHDETGKSQWNKPTTVNG